jgi:hypothetical protein
MAPNTSVCTCPAGYYGSLCQLSTAPVAVNDNCPSATSVSFPVSNLNVTLLNYATTSSFECQSTVPAVWYSVVNIPVGKPIRFTTCGGSTDTMIGIQPTCTSTATCNDDACGTQSQIEWMSNSSSILFQIGARNASSSLFSVCAVITPPSDTWITCTNQSNVGFPQYYYTSELNITTSNIPSWCDGGPYNKFFTYQNAQCDTPSQIVNLIKDQSAPTLTGVPVNATYPCGSTVPIPSVSASDDCFGTRSVYISVNNITGSCSGKYVNS